MNSARRAVILGGTGAIGGATARRLAAAGWRVEVTGRAASSMPAELTALGVRFFALERADTAGIGELIGTGADLVVDLLAYRGADVRALVGPFGSAGSVVVISGRAVYVDSAGRHLNSPVAPLFVCPLREDNPTVEPLPDDDDPFTATGYGRGKVAVEHAALDSGLPITVLRPSKVHGRWARQARTREFVTRLLAGEDIVLHGGGSIDHTTAAANTAALIEAVADRPAARVLNSADPDAPTAAAIVQGIASAVGRPDAVRFSTADVVTTGRRHPWDAAHPVVLDTRAAAAVGYQPAGSALGLMVEEIDWVRSLLERGD